MAAKQSNLMFKVRRPPTRLLVVEDEPDTAELLKFALQESGYQPEVVGSAAQAVDLLKQQPFDLVIVDWLLPDGTGAKVCSAVRHEHGRRPIPIIMLSGACGEQTQALKQCDPDLYLAKPITMQNLLTHVHGMLAQNN